MISTVMYISFPNFRFFFVKIFPFTRTPFVQRSLAIAFTKHKKKQMKNKFKSTVNGLTISLHIYTYMSQEHISVSSDIRRPDLQTWLYWNVVFSLRLFHEKKRNKKKKNYELNLENLIYSSKECSLAPQTKERSTQKNNKTNEIVTKTYKRAEKNEIILHLTENIFENENKKWNARKVTKALHYIKKNRENHQFPIFAIVLPFNWIQYKAKF